MKSHLVVIFIIVFNFLGFSQSLPVAVDDSASVKLGERITVNVIKNDYHPDGLPFWIAGVNYHFTHTDSTISYFVNFDDNHNHYGEKQISYYLIDESGIPGSTGILHLNIINDFNDTLDKNNISALINPYPNHFWQGNGFVNNPGGIDSSLHYEYPKGSGKNSIFNSTFWIAGVDQNEELRLSAETYRQNGIDFWSGPLSIVNNSLEIDTVTVLSWHKVWKLDRSDIEYHKNNWHKTGYKPIENIISWPAHGDTSINQRYYLAPFVDIGGDGNYDPYLGDYPLIKGDQCAFFIFNDLRKDNTETKGSAIGIEVHGMMYQFKDLSNQALNNTTFLSYKIFNRSKNTLKDTYIGIWTDIDLGYQSDDYVGCDVERGVYYIYNGKEVDGHGEAAAYGENPPTQGVLFLGGPNIDANNLDDPDGGCDESVNGIGFGDAVVDNERLGMTGFVYFDNSNGTCGDPEIPLDYYNYLKSIWKDTTSLKYGESGHENYSYGPTCKFMFPGLSDPCMWGTDGVHPNGPVNWSEETGYNGNPNPPADRRGIGSMGPFTFLPGAMQKIDIAYITARGDNGPISSVELLKVYADSIRARFAENPDDFGTQYLDLIESGIETHKLNIYPNPVGNILNVENHGAFLNDKFVIHDLYGRILSQGLIMSANEIRINVSALKKGIYIVSLINDNQKYCAIFVKK